MINRNEAERRRIEDVASKYRASGYDVLLEPSVIDLPEFLAGYRPDFLARLGNENVLVEVRHSTDADQATPYRELAERVHAHPGWRLDLVLSPTGSRPVASDYPLLPMEAIAKRYDEAQRLADLGYWDAAFLLAWAATEAALRLIAERDAVQLQRSATAALLKELVSLGSISRDEYYQLARALDARNAVAHGFAARETADTARSLVETGRQLLEEAKKAA